ARAVAKRLGVLGRIEELNVLSLRTTCRRAGATVDACSLDGVDEISVRERIAGLYGSPALLIRRKGSTGDFFVCLNVRFHCFIPVVRSREPSLSKISIERTPILPVKFYG